MSDKPIIFSGPMVRAILDDCKTQERRLLKYRGFPPDFRGPQGCQTDPECWGWEDGETGKHIGIVPATDGSYDRFWQPTYAAGDHLWVQETWCNDIGAPDEISYQATAVDDGWSADEVAAHRWRPSIHMPRWASRITPLVTRVRVQRVQDISNDDARAEGAPFWWREQPENERHPWTTATGMFRDLWDTIYGPGAWDRNDWVAAYTFERIKP